MCLSYLYNTPFKREKKNNLLLLSNVYDECIYYIETYSKKNLLIAVFMSALNIY